MGFVFRLFLLLLFFVSVYLSFETHEVIDKQSRFFCNFLPIEIMNTADHKVSLYSSSAPFGKPIGNIPSMGTYTFKYSGKSGDWLYGSLNGYDVFIKHSDREKVVSILGSYFPLEWFIYSYIPGVFFLFISMLLFWNSKSAKQKKLNARVVNAEKKVEEERNARIRAEKKLREETNKTKQLSVKQKELIFQFELKEKDLRKQFASESDKYKRKAEEDARIEISVMQDSYNRLNNQYQDLKNKYTRIQVISA